MLSIRKTGATALAFITVVLPAVAASAACLNRTDMHAMQTASLQQRLTVAAFTCHDTAAYNRFVLSHRTELQQSDAALLAYFQKNGGTAAYHTYKTHLANASALESSRDDSFCGAADDLFQQTSGGGGTLADMLDGMPSADTGYAACYMADAQPVRGRSQRVIRTAEVTPPAPPRMAAVEPPSPRVDRPSERRYARRERDDYYDGDRWGRDDRDDDYARNPRDDRYADAWYGREAPMTYDPPPDYRGR